MKTILILPGQKPQGRKPAKPKPYYWADKDLEPINGRYESESEARKHTPKEAGTYFLVIKGRKFDLQIDEITNQ